LKQIKRSGIKIGIDLLFGTSREYLDEILEEMVFQLRSFMATSIPTLEAFLRPALKKI